jgi:tetratricopeptide (TPR) repeat protein
MRFFIISFMLTVCITNQLIAQTSTQDNYKKALKNAEFIADFYKNAATHFPQFVEVEPSQAEATFGRKLMDEALNLANNGNYTAATEKLEEQINRYSQLIDSLADVVWPFIKNKNSSSAYRYFTDYLRGTKYANEAYEKAEDILYRVEGVKYYPVWERSVEIGDGDTAGKPIAMMDGGIFAFAFGSPSTENYNLHLFAVKYDAYGNQRYMIPSSANNNTQQNKNDGIIQLDDNTAVAANMIHGGAKIETINLKTGKNVKQKEPPVSFTGDVVKQTDGKVGFVYESWGTINYFTYNVETNQINNRVILENAPSSPSAIAIDQKGVLYFSINSKDEFWKTEIYKVGQDGKAKLHRLFNNVMANFLIVTSDNDLVVGGKSFKEEMKHSSLSWVARIDHDYEHIVFDNRYSADGTVEVHDIVELSDGSFILVQTVMPFGNVYHTEVMKIGEYGHYVWKTKVENLLEPKIAIYDDDSIALTGSLDEYGESDAAWFAKYILSPN